jgi:hypothetical protein
MVLLAQYGKSSSSDPSPLNQIAQSLTGYIRVSGIDQIGKRNIPIGGTAGAGITGNFFQKWSESFSGTVPTGIMVG